MDPNLPPVHDELPPQRAPVHKHLHRFLYGFVIFTVITLAASGGFLTGKAQTPPTPKPAARPLTPTLAPSLQESNPTTISGTLNSNTLLNRGIEMEFCDYPWDYEPKVPGAGDVECIKINLSGFVEKNVNSQSDKNTILYSNADQYSQYATKSAEAKKLYEQITQPSILAWLEKPKLYPVGSTFEHLKLRAEVKNYYTVTGNFSVIPDETDEYKKMKIIIERMHALAK